MLQKQVLDTFNLLLDTYMGIWKCMTLDKTISALLSTISIQETERSNSFLYN